MTKTLNEIQRQLLGAFFEESFEGLQQLEAGLLSLDPGDNASSATINDIFRVAHSIKGGAGSFGLHGVGELGHAMETLLDRFRAGELTPTPDSLSLLLESVDVLRELLSALREERAYPSERSQALLTRLTAAAHANANVPRAASMPAAVPAAGAVKLYFKPFPHLLENGNEPVRLLRELHELGKVDLDADWSKLPDLRSMEPSRCYLAWNAEVLGTTVAAVTELFAWVEGDAELVIEPLDADPAAATAPTADANKPAGVATKSASTAIQRAEGDGALGSIRVAVDKIDLLMNMVGELVITQSMLGELDGDGPLDARRIERLREGLALLARNTRSLQESVMQLRSVPISVVFSRFPRLVHDLSRQLGKNVELHISGQSTELDKTILEKLGDPLVHLVRNSMDHGFESEEARRALGKPAVGRLDLRAFHSGSDIVVEVQDDGKGIDRERVLARARELKLLGPDETPGDAAIRDFIFAPGFSTAKVVSDVSGRGVGMDVVRQNIKSLGGDVFVETVLGKGTRISLRLPLTLAIIDGQLIRVGGFSYVVPLLSIVEAVQVDRRHVSLLQGKKQVYRLRNELIPMVQLRKLLGVKSKDEAGDGSLMVIVEADNEKIGLLVDDLHAQQQVVVKSLEANYGRVEGLAGATILGDGSVAFILDVAGIGRLFKKPHHRDAVRAA